jgi:putative protease
VDIKCSLIYNAPLEITISDSIHSISLKGETVTKSINKPLSRADIVNAIGILGSSYLTINTLDIKLDNNVFVSLSSIKQIRREALDLLLKKREQLIVNIKENSYQDVHNKTLLSNNKYYFKVRTKEQYDYLVKKVNGIIIYPSNIGIEGRIQDYTYQLSRLDTTINNTNYLASNIGQIKKSDNIIIDNYLPIINTKAINLIRKYTQNIIFISLEVNILRFSTLTQYDYNLGYTLYGRSELMVSKASIGKIEQSPLILESVDNKKYLILKDDKDNTIILGQRIKRDLLDLKRAFNYTNEHYKLDFYDESVEELEEVLKYYHIIN